MNRKSIEYVLTKMGVSTSTIKQSGEWAMMSCPLAPWTHAGGVDRKPSFGVHEAKGISGVHCFSCGFHGGMLSLVQKYGQYAIKDGLWTQEEMQELIDFVLLAEEEDNVEELKEIVTITYVPDGLQRYLSCKHEYFEKRGIKDATIMKWNLGFVEKYQDDKVYMNNRVLFPLYAKVGMHLELKGVVGRSVVGEEPKYKNAPPSFKKSQYVYGGWLAEGKTKIAVVEGPVDCLILNQNLEEAGLDDMFAVALLGADPSEAQIEWLKDHAEEVICFLDNDPSGKLGNKKLINALDSHLIVSVVKWKDEHKDPDEAGAYAIEMIKNRKSLLESKIEKILGKL